MTIATFESLYVKAWDGTSDPTSLTPADILTLDQFTAPQDTDRMAVGYLVPGAPAFPRLTLNALPALVEAGQEPLLHWAMFDIDNEGHKTWGSPAKAAQALQGELEALDDLWLDGVHGGVWGGYTTPAGLRLVARLDPPLPVSYATAFLRQLATTLPCAGDIDEACFDWTRFFRLPCARRDGVVLGGLAAHLGGPSLNPYAQGFDLVADAPKARTSTPTAHVPTSFELDWDDRRHAAGFDWLLRGEPVPPDADGKSFPTARRTLAIIAGRGKYDDADTLFSFIAPSAEATVGSSISDTTQLWELCCWVAERQSLANDTAPDASDPDALPPAAPLSATEWAAVRRALRGKDSRHMPKLEDGLPLSYHKKQYTAATWHVARTLMEGTELPPDAVYRALHPSVAAQREPLLPDLWAKVLELQDKRHENGDEDDQVRRAFVAMHPLTLATNQGRLYQLDTQRGDYQVTSEMLIEKHFEQFTRPGLPFEADYQGVPMRSVMARYGAGVKSVVYVSGQKGTTYDAAEGRVVEGIHNLAKCTPRYHEDINRWLGLLGGTDPEGLLDWLACVTYTHDQPLCALYINGAPGIGKSLLARGIASLWGSSPVDYNKATHGDFNAELLQGPLLLADEGVVVNRNNMEMASITFRSIISGQGLGINAKYQAVMPMVGAVRVLVCANHTNGLPFKESLGRDGIEAITQRVMYLEVGDAPRVYLERLGGRGAIKTWAPSDCSPGRIAEHLLYLKQARTVVPGRRFLVEGRTTPWHSQYAARQGIKPFVLQVAFAMLESARRGNRTLRVEEAGGVVWVSSQDLKANWEEYTRVRKPKPADIVDALEQLASDKQRRRVTGRSSATCYGVPIRAFVDADVCEIEDFTIQERSKSE